MITYFLDPAELDRQVAIIVAERAKLCNPAAIDAAFVTLANIAARAELKRIRAKQQIAKYQLSLPIGEAA